VTYSVKEIFLTLQGEGVQAGSRAVFLRLAGCNLWSGRESDRASAQCRFCDTDFVGTDGHGGGKFRTADELADAVAATWGPLRERRLVVVTGGEPMLQLDETMVDALHARKFRVAVETNGTIEVLPAIDWICVSPKAGTEIVQRRGNELARRDRQRECDLGTGCALAAQVVQAGFGQLAAAVVPAVRSRLLDERLVDLGPVRIAVAERQLLRDEQQQRQQYVDQATGHGGPGLRQADIVRRAVRF